MIDTELKLLRTMVCEKHRLKPAIVYSQCIGCELDQLRAEIERLRTDNADLLFTLRVQIGAAIARTDDERAAVSRAFEKARQP